MGIRDRLASIIAGKQAPQAPRATKEAPTVTMNVNTPYHYRRDNYESYADEGYRKNAIVFRCVNEIANGAASIPFKAFQGDQELEQHPIIDLIARPNPMQAGVEYFQALYSYLLLSGNSYPVRTDVNNQVRELHLLRPDRMRLVPSKTSVPSAFEYILNGKVVERYDADPMTGESQVKHIKLFNPLDDFMGLSPLMAAAADIDQHNMIAKHNLSLLNNGARPSGAVVFRPQDDRGVPIQLTDGQRDQLRDDLEARFSGPDNAGRPVLLEGDFDWKEMGISPKDMDFISQRNMTAKDIALCFGVPSQLIGVPDAQTYANVQEARLALYEETIIPMARRVESDMNEWLAPMFGEDIRITYDVDQIPAITERRRRIYENVVSAVREGVITRNEARERLQLEPVRGGDDLYIAANLFPLGSAAPEGEGSASVDPVEAGRDAYGMDGGVKEELRRDVFTTQEEAAERADQIGCIGTHSHTEDGRTIYMPCASHDDYERFVGQPVKAESDVDTTPTQAMATEAQRALEWRREHDRGGTDVGVARAVQLKNRQRLSPNTVRRMVSYFARHEVDKEAEGFRRGEPGYPSAGRIAWGLWGGDPGQRWAERKVKELDRESEKAEEIMAYQPAQVAEHKDREVSERITKALEKKVEDHNAEHGDVESKRVTLRMLKAVFRRGVGAYYTNPSSVRPSVNNPDQWGLGRVNAFLYAVRNGRFKSGKFDTDLLPEGHPLSTRD
jgi:HK97 family phage portal protein